MPDASPADPRRAFDRVVVASGHMADLPGRTPARFPAPAEPATAAALERALREWNVGPGSLVITGGARGVDIIAAERALALGAEVWLLLALPDAQFVAESVDIPGTDWLARFAELRRRCPTWTQADELGPPATGEDVFERNNDWAVAVAGAQAPAGGLRVVVVWDGEEGDGRGGTAHLAARARAAGAALAVIRPG